MNLFFAIRLSEANSCCTPSKTGKTRRLINEEEDIEANGTCIRSHDAKSVDTSNPVLRSNAVKNRSVDTDLESDHLPLLLPVRVDSMLTGRAAKKTRPNTISSFTVSEPPVKEWDKGAPLVRSHSFTYTGRSPRHQRKNSFEGDASEYAKTSSTSIPPTIIVDHIDQNEDLGRSDEERSRTESEIEPCLSKYLDSTPKQHEVYSSVFGNRPKRTRKRSVTKVLPENVRRSGSVHIQRQASMLILAERRKSMTLQIAGFGETFAFFNEICNDRKITPRGHAALGVKKKIEARRHQRASDGSSRVSTDSADLLKVPDINTSEESILVRRPRLLSQKSIDIQDERNATDKEDANSRYSSNSMSQYPISSLKSPAENSIIKKSSSDGRQEDYSHDLASIPRKFPSSVTEPVKVSALKISRKKLMPLREEPVSYPKFAEKSETESRSSICRTPLGSIDEVEEENEYFGTEVAKRVPALTKSSLKAAQPISYVGEDRSEVADWLRKNTSIFEQHSEQSDSDSTAKGSVVDIKGEKSVDLDDANAYPEKYMPVGYKENYDTDEEVSAAFLTVRDSKSKRGIKDARKTEPDGLRSKDSGICSGFIRIPDKDSSDELGNLNEAEVLDAREDKSAGGINRATVVDITLTNPSPKTFSNAMYMIDNTDIDSENDSLAPLNNNNYQSKEESRRCLNPNLLYGPSKVSWKTRSNEEFCTEHERLLENGISSFSESVGTNIRRSSSCEFEFDNSESIVDNDIAKIRSLRRKSKKQKMETKNGLQSSEKRKSETDILDETVL